MGHIGLKASGPKIIEHSRMMEATKGPRGRVSFRMAFGVCSIVTTHGF